MKHTKRPQGVAVKWNENTYTIKRSEYQCPVCRTEYHNTLEQNVTRFKCNCGQELIVK
jgi:DNA-directed RNA polymerase subunit RPC12/RpoP